MKRYRDENGKLLMSLEEIKKATVEEGRSYYKKGHIYKYKDIEYVLIEVGPLYWFQSFEGYNLFVTDDSIGTHLPEVASDGLELILIE